MFVTLKEAQEIMGCSRQHINWLCNEKKLQKYKSTVGGVKFKRKDIEKLIKPEPVK